MSLEDLQRRLRETLSEEDKALGASIVADLAALTARASSGEDVSAELVHVRAQALNMTSAGQEEVRREWLDWIGSTVRGVVTAALAGV